MTTTEEIKKYIIIEELGRGSEGRVYKAKRRSDNLLVAIKVIHFGNTILNELFKTITKYDDTNDKKIEYVTRELNIMKKLNHINIVKLLDTINNKNEIWIINELCSNGAISGFLKKKYKDGFSDEILIATILKNVVTAIKYLHDCGFIHRDIKGGNILINDNGCVKLCDFGVSNLISGEDHITLRSTFVGTLCWMAPEFFTGEPHNEKVDIWSIGVTALELGFGKPPHYNLSPIKIINLIQNGIKLDTIQKRKFSSSFYDFVEKCLISDPFKRYSARQLLRHSFLEKAKDNNYIKKNLL